MCVNSSSNINWIITVLHFILFHFHHYHPFSSFFKLVLTYLIVLCIYIFDFFFFHLIYVHLVKVNYSRFTFSYPYDWLVDAMTFWPGTVLFTYFVIYCLTKCACSFWPVFPLRVMVQLCVICTSNAKWRELIFLATWLHCSVMYHAALLERFAVFHVGRFRITVQRNESSSYRRAFTMIWCAGCWRT